MKAESAILGLQPWNDRHLAALVERIRIGLALRLNPDGATAEDLAPRLEDLARAEAEAEAALRAAGQMPALHSLALRCGLDGFSTSVVALCLAVEVDADAAAMLPRLGVGGRPTPGLALALDGAGAPSRALAFSPEAPLMALRLVELEPGLPLAATPMRLSPRVRDLLLGHDRLDAQARFLRPIPEVALPPALAAVRDAAAALLLDGRAPIAITGPAEAGGLAIAAEAAREAGLRPMRLDPALLPAGAEDAAALAVREALLSGLAILLDATAPAVLRDALLAMPHLPLLLLGEDAAALPPNLAAGAPVLALDPPDQAGRAAQWQAAAPWLAPPEAARLARQFALPPETMARLAAGTADAPALWRRAREGTAPILAELGERILPRAGWDDLILPAEAMVALREVAAAAEARAVVDADCARPGARGQGMAVLLAGPSGTGKTLAAEVLAGTLGLDLFRIDLAGVVSKWIGDTEKNLKRVFDAAEAGGAVLFFDEADALFGKRTEVKDSHDRHANVEVAYLLQRMEAHRGLSILATNLRASLDQAFLRRLRFAIDMPFPDEAARRAIWARHIPAGARKGAIDLDALARLDLPGGAIRNVVLNGASLAVAAGRPLATAHLMAAARREFAKLGRLATGGAR